MFFKKSVTISALANSSSDIHIVLFLIFIQEARDKLSSDVTHAQIVCQNILARAI
jgi:regulator of PEP synthase PpsR (kinase-PPPase family)